MIFSRSKPWQDAVYWALDLETSSLDPASGIILSVGMVPIRQGMIHWGEHYYSVVGPPSLESIATDAIAIHHILPDELAGAPSPSAVVNEIAARLADDAALLVHYASLDIGFLKRAFRRERVPWPNVPVIDTQVLKGRLERRRRILEPHARPLPDRLAELRAVFGLPPFEQHHALHDALATAELFLALRARLGAKTLRQLR